MLPKTYTLRKYRNMEVDKMVEVKTVRIRHKAIAKSGLENPIKFQLLPKFSAMIDEKGEAEVPSAIGDALLKNNPELYELVVREEIKPVVQETPSVTSKPSELQKAPVAKKVKEEPDKAKVDFAKQITEQ
jgi:hypothetical protein